MIKVLTLNNQVEASFLEEVLKEKNIPYILKKFHDMAYNGLFEMQLGWGMIEAYEENSEEIKLLYNEIAANNNVNNVKEESKNDEENFNNEAFNEIKISGRRTGLIVTVLFIIVLIIVLVLYNYNYRTKHKDTKTNYIIKNEKNNYAKAGTNRLGLSFVNSKK